MKLLTKVINKPKLSYTKVLLISVTLAGLSGCNGGNKNSGVAIQDSELGKFEQRRAIVIKQIQNGEPVVIPTSLQTVSELKASQSAGYGSMLGKPALVAVGGNALLASDPCVIMNDVFAPSSFSADPSGGGYATVKRVTSSDSTERSSVISSSLSAGYGLAKAEATSEIKNSALFSKSSLGFDFIFGVRGIHSLNNQDTSSLSKFFNSQNLTFGSLNSRFYNYCGDSFVSKEAYVVQLKGSLNIEFEDETKASSFAASLGGSYGDFASLSAAINNAESSSHVKGSVIVKLSQVGGMSGELSKALGPEAIVSCSLENFSRCEEIMTKMIAYSGALESQIYDDKGNLIVSNLSYQSPTLTKYNKLIRMSNQDASAKGIAAIDKLNLFYLNTLKLYYALEHNGLALRDEAKADFDKNMFDIVSKREKYIVGMSSTCYQNPDLCADELLPKLFKDINELYPFPDKDKFNFYSKLYSFSNFMNLNGKFGSLTNGANIDVTLIPNIAYLHKPKDGVSTPWYSYSYVNSSIPNCDSTLCNPGSMTVQVQAVESIPNVNYRIFVNNYSNLRTDCDENKVTKGLNCSGYNYSGSGDSEKVGKYKWKDEGHYSYIGGLSFEDLQQYATPNVEKFGVIKP